MGGDGENVEYPGGVSSSDDQTDHGDDGETCDGRGVGIPPGGVGTRSSRLTTHTGVHLEMEGDHHDIGSITTHLLTLYQHVSDAGDEPDDEMEGSGCGT